MLSLADKAQLLARMPRVKAYRQTQRLAETFSIIPAGYATGQLWFTYWRDQHICCQLLDGPASQASAAQASASQASAAQASASQASASQASASQASAAHVQILSTQCSTTVALGTVLQGTFFNYRGLNHFSVENIEYFAGEPVGQNDLLDIFLHFFEEQPVTSIRLGLPVMTTSYHQAQQISNTLPYKVASIQRLGYRDSATPVKAITYVPKHFAPRPIAFAPRPIAFAPRPITYVPFAPRPITYVPKPFAPKPFAPTPIAPTPIAPTPIAPTPITYAPVKTTPITSKYATFLIKANRGADCYTLYSAEGTACGAALVPSYTCSVMLNAVFRHIKENANLDHLEESDSDEDFEDIRPDKYVDLEKSAKVKCVYSRKFQKWQPVEFFANNSPAPLVAAADLYKYR